MFLFMLNNIPISNLFYCLFFDLTAVIELINMEYFLTRSICEEIRIIDDSIVHGASQHIISFRVLNGGERLSALSTLFNDGSTYVSCHQDFRENSRFLPQGYLLSSDANAQSVLRVVKETVTPTGDITTPLSVFPEGEVICRLLDLLNRLRVEHRKVSIVEPVPQSSTANLPPIFVKNWMEKENASIFFLSNGTVQVMFDDNTQVLVLSKGLAVQYYDKDTHEWSVYTANWIPYLDKTTLSYIIQTSEMVSCLIPEVRFVRRE